MRRPTRVIKSEGRPVEYWWFDIILVNSKIDVNVKYTMSSVRICNIYKYVLINVLVQKSNYFAIC